MKDGIYKFWVNPFSRRNSQGFEAEIEFDGETYHYKYDKSLVNNVVIAEVTLKNGKFTIEHKLPLISSQTKEIYGLETNKFHKVNLVCQSPNHWGDNNIGNKYYLFMLESCKTTTDLRGFHSENLISELAQHRKVLEVLGNSCVVKKDSLGYERQLSGLGYNCTVSDELILRLSGTHKRVVKVKF